MTATIITIGDELLNGQTIDTNAAWLGQELNGIGVDVCAGMTIKDTKEAISAAITTASTNSDLIIMTGGLGPTRDDVTKQAIADHYGDEMIFNQENYEVILEEYSVYVYPRVSSGTVEHQFKNHPKIHRVAAPIIEISSTFIRKQYALGKNVQAMLPDAVWKYMDEMNFYR